MLRRLLSIGGIIGLFLAEFFVFFIIIFGYLPAPRDAAFGVTFSTKQAEALNLDWRKTYEAILQELGVKRLRLVAYWDEIESEPGKFDFSKLDIQFARAEQHNAQVILAIGRKVPRWPECHIPSWALEGENHKAALLAYLPVIVERYKTSPSLRMWQIENEPLFPFGECPPDDESLLDREIALVRQLDPKHPVLVTDSGEVSFWTKVASKGDVLGVTMYRVTWNPILKYRTYPFPARVYRAKAALIRFLYNIETIGIELQLEPWVPSVPISKHSFAEQEKSIDLGRFRDTVQYAKRARLREHYAWGAEWWYWAKEQGRPEFWEEAKKLFP
jgi:hypothetical protein